MTIERQFQQAIAAAGLTPPDDVIGDGKLHRFSANGKPHNTSGWYALHLDGVPAGVFGDWGSGLEQVWCCKSPQEITPDEREFMQRRVAADRAAREFMQEEQYKAAAVTCQNRYNAAVPADPAHAYATKKNIILPGFVRQEGNALLVPVRDARGEIQSLQAISPDGSKRFATGGRMAGGFCIIGDTSKAPAVLIVCEGFATGASLHAATGCVVVVAFNAGNLKAVAVTMRSAYPAAKMLICGDDDKLTNGNPGRTKANEAARVAVAVAVFPDGLPEGGTDFNDLAVAAGLPAVQAQIEAALDAATSAPKTATSAVPDLTDDQRTMMAATLAVTNGSFFGDAEKALPTEVVIGRALRHRESGLPEAVGLHIAKVWSAAHGGDAVKAFLEADPDYKKGPPLTTASILKLASQCGWVKPLPAPGPLESHVMAKFLEVDLNPRAAKWLIPGLIEEGAVTIAGGRGVGKTTCVVPLSAVAAGLHAFGDPLAPKAWRHVIYVTEHADQVMRILSALVQHGGLGINPDDVRERFHLVHAARILSGEMVQVGPLYRKRYGRTHKGVEVRPLVVLDTLAACVAMESENDNAEASNAMANIKQRFEGLPVWLIAHVAKDAIGRSNTQNITARGAGAFEADAIQNLYIVPEADKRYLVIGKMRCEPRFGTELEIESGQAVVDAVDEWGDTERTTVRWGITRPIEKNRAEARQEAQEATRKAEEWESRGAMIEAVLTAQAIGHPLSRTSLKSKSGMKATEAIGLIQQLMDEGWIHEIDVPTKRRLNAKKASFLVALTTEQHDRWMAKHEFPPELSIIPPSWCKAEEAVASDNTESAPEGGSTPTQTHPDGATDSGVEDLEFRSFPTSPESATDSGVPESEIPFVPKAFVPYRQKQRERTGMVGAHSPFISPIPDDGNGRERTGTNGNERACFSEIEAKNPPISGADHLTGADEDEGEI